MKVFGRDPTVSAVGHLGLLLAAALGCWSPVAWISFPAAAVLLLWLPGRAVIRLWRPISELPGAGCVAVAAAMVLMPIPLDWLWRWSNERLAVWVLSSGLNLLLWAVACRNPVACAVGPKRPIRYRAGLAGLVIYVGICTFGSYWLPEAGGRLNPRPAHDYIKHHAILWSLERYPLPLHSIFYADESATPYYYYHYHHLLPAALRKLTGDRVSIGLAFGFSSAVLAMVFVGTVYLLAGTILGPGRPGGALLAATCVSVVGAWDIIPVLVRMLAGRRGVVVLDSWTPVPWRIHNLMTQYQWCPQHIAATLALLLSIIWLRQAPRSPGWLLAAPLLAASLFGSSVYLAMSIFPAAAIWAASEVWRERAARRQLAAAMGGLTLLALLLMLPQGAGYAEMDARFPGNLTARWDRFDWALLGWLAPPGVLANLLDAPWLLLVEFGLPGAAVVLLSRAGWSGLWHDRGLRLLILASLLGVAAFLTVRSQHSPIDYGFRIAVMPTQVLAAICAGLLVDGGLIRRWARPWSKPVLALGLLLGLPVGLYEAPMMAARTLFWRTGDWSDAGAVRFLREHTSPDAVVQGDPVRRVTLPQLTDRRVGVADPGNPHVRVFYPRDPEGMRRVFSEVQRALSTNSSAVAYEILRQAGVTHVLAGEPERQRYGSMSQFDDRTRFDRLYADDQARVWRLVETAGD